MLVRTTVWSGALILTSCTLPFCPSLTEVTVFYFFSLHIFFVLFPLSTAKLQTEGKNSKDNFFFHTTVARSKLAS